jgi:hypothetical protein
MGLLDIFSKGKRDERSRTKNIERALNKHAQSADRSKALEGLAEDGSEEALYGLMRRFGFVYDKTIEDEQEKEWIFETLCEKGKAALPAVRRYLVNADSVSWALRILDKIASPEEHLAAIEEALARHEPGYERDPSKKIQLVKHLGGFEHPKTASLALPYLRDMDEGVRYTAAEALMQRKDEALARASLLELFASDAEESLRIRLRIAEGFSELGWAVGPAERPAVERKMPDQFTLDRDGKFAKRQ